jgi:hypothetical protein
MNAGAARGLRRRPRSNEQPPRGRERAPSLPLRRSGSDLAPHEAGHPLATKRIEHSIHASLTYGPPLDSKQLARRPIHGLIVAGAVPCVASVVGENLAERERGTDVEKANAEIEILDESTALIEGADRSDELQRTHHRARHESPAGSKDRSHTIARG